MGITFIICLIMAYLMGSLSSAVIVCKLMGYTDPRTEGSGNPGATNVLRIAGKGPALLVLLGDALKGFIPVMLAYLFGVKNLALGLVGVAALLGHIYPAFFEFRGGKGVATALGAILAMSFWLGIIAIGTWIAVVAITRYSSLAALCAISIATILSPWSSGSISYFIPIVIMALLLFWRHQDNITRLREGTESKVNC